MLMKRIAALGVLMFILTSSCLAQSSIVFEDHFDGTGAGTWKLTDGAAFGHISVEHERLRVDLVTPPSFLDLTHVLPRDAQNKPITFENGVIEATFHITRNAQIGFAARGRGYFPAFDTENAAAIFRGDLVELTANNHLPFTVNGQDVRARFEALDSHLTFSLWPLHDPSKRVTLTANDRRSLQSGEVGIWMRAFNGPATVEVDDVVISVPEPSAGCCAVCAVAGLPTISRIARRCNQRRRQHNVSRRIPKGRRQ